MPVFSPFLLSLQRYKGWKGFPRSSLTRRSPCFFAALSPRSRRRRGSVVTTQRIRTSDAGIFFCTRAFLPSPSSRFFCNAAYSGIRPRVNGRGSVILLPPGNQGTQLKPCSSLVNREKVKRGGRGRKRERERGRNCEITIVPLISPLSSSRVSTLNVATWKRVEIQRVRNKARPPPALPSPFLHPQERTREIREAGEGKSCVQL